MTKLSNIKISSGLYSIIFMLYNLLAFNSVFFAKLHAVNNSLAFSIGSFTVVWALGSLACLLLFWRFSTKLLSVLFLLINSSVFYFVKTYNVSVDEEMLINVLQTNKAETADLLNVTWGVYVFILGVIPSVFITFIHISPIKIWQRFVSVLSFIGITAAIVVPNLGEVAPFLRNNKPLKYQLIPVNYIGAIISYVKHHRKKPDFITIGNDAEFVKYWQNEKYNLIIFIVGETARAANFGFDGYERDTTEPLNLYRANIVNYTNAWSCGTSTAVSVPCMFSKDSRNNYDNGSLEYTENVLDILHKNSYDVLWLDNNSDCKSTCDRVEQIIFCKENHDKCNDFVMFPALEERLQKNRQNTAIFLHQIGSHGPKYYLRYTPEFARFQPECKTEKLNECDLTEVRNTYDNTILFTSHIVAQTIETAKKYADKYNTLVFYVSDHGESLGEHGFYLHSAPYVIAPDEQKHIPFLIWASDETYSVLGIDKECLQKNASAIISHDNIFHTLLGLSGIKTAEYTPDMDLFSTCRKK